MGKVTIGWIPEKTKKNKGGKANQQPKTTDQQNEGGQAQNQEPENQQQKDE